MEYTISISLQSTGPIPVVLHVNVSSTLDSGNLTKIFKSLEPHAPSNNQAENTQEPGNSGMDFQLPTT